MKARLRKAITRDDVTFGRGVSLEVVGQRGHMIRCYTYGYLVWIEESDLEFGAREQ